MRTRLLWLVLLSAGCEHDILYQRYDGATTDVFRFRCGSERLLVPNAMQARWSPDGQSLAFLRDIGEKRDLFVASADGSSPANLTAGVVGSVQSYDWNPDSERLVAAVNDVIVALAADGSASPLALTSAEYADDPSWSPDGTRVAYARRWDRASMVQLMTMNADGTDKQVLSETGFRGRPGGRWGVEPAWSPDGQFIVFDREVGERLTLERQKWIIRTDGTRPQRLDSRPEVRVRFRDASPAVWSDDSQYFAYTAFWPAVFVYTFNGFGFERVRFDVAGPPIADNLGGFQPDSHTLLFARGLIPNDPRLLTADVSLESMVFTELPVRGREAQWRRGTRSVCFPFG